MATSFKVDGLQNPDMYYWAEPHCGYEDSQPVKIQEMKPYELPPRVMGCWAQPFVGIQERGVFDAQATEPPIEFPILERSKRYGAGPHTAFAGSTALPLQTNF